MDARPRAIQRFLANPSSIRYAVAAIISSIGVLVVLGAVLMRIFDPDEYPTMGDALWFTLQTVTTVGYGDNVPDSALGRFVASAVMLISIGLLTVVTAIITSLFVQSAGQHGLQSDRDAAADSLARIETALAHLHERLDRLDHQERGHDARSEEAPA